MTASHDWLTAELAWGSPEPKPEPWSSGSWSLDRRGDELADIRFQDKLVLRSVRAVARDRDWGTVPATVIAARERQGRLEIDLRLRGNGADISATLLVTARERLQIEFDALSLTDFESNRLGLTVLHPPAVAGQALAVGHPDGTRTDTAFPSSVSPHQPAFDISSLEWESDGVNTHLAFAGEIFEMEDQRNWTDASFKTYSTPLALPFPVLITAGSRTSQSIELTCHRTHRSAQPTPARIVLRPQGPAPDITVALSSAPDPVPATSTPATAVLVEVHTDAPNHIAVIDRALATALPIDLRIVAASPADIAAVLDRIPATRLTRLGVFSPITHITEPEQWKVLVDESIRRKLSAQLVAGTRAHFAELNRNHDRLPAGASVTFSITPQMHSRERVQLVESIPIQATVARDATRIAHGQPVHVGPVTLRPRFNAVATTPAPDEAETLIAGYGPALLPDASDERQRSPALAAWAVASFAALSSVGVASISYFEQWGPRGIFDGEGDPYPVLEALELLHALRGQTLLVPETIGQDVHVVGAAGTAGVTVIGANLSAQDRTVDVEWPGGQGTLVLPAFGTAQLSSTV